MDISKIIDFLYLSSKVQAGHVEELKQRNISLVISMIGGHPPPELSDGGCQVLWLQTCDSIFIPIPIDKLMIGVCAALDAIQNGNKVLVFCAKGRHRSVAMAASILIAMGYSSGQAMNIIKIKRGVADPNIWHISRRIREFERRWNTKGNRPISRIKSVEDAYAETTTRVTSRMLLFVSSLNPNRQLLSESKPT